ncbi:replication protein [Salmonella enterica]|nr:hypothetical protein [Salmonella enterica]EGF9616839.1 replication protein [Salmonella enterica]EGI3724677.1 replication protein [Salmonella enterica]
MSMSNTAEIYKFPAPVPTQQECRMADLENGYLRLANQIQDALCIVELSGREFRVLNAIIRLTYGWSKKSDRIANSLIADKTALKVKHVSEAVLSLAYRNIIILRRIGQTRYIGINTNLDKWAYSKPHCSKCPVSFPDDEIATWIISVPETRDSYPRKGGRASPKTGIVIPENRDSVLPHSAIPENGDSYPRKGGRASPKTGNTKDIIPKTNIKDLTPFNPPKGKVKFDPLSIPCVMRSDIQVGDYIRMPKKLRPMIQASSYSQFRDDSAFTGDFLVSSVRLVGNSRQPDANSWVTVIEAHPTGGIAAT